MNQEIKEKNNHSGDIFVSDYHTLFSVSFNNESIFFGSTYCCRELRGSHEVFSDVNPY